MTQVHSFPPLVGPGARILILGSAPGIKSLEAQQYYAHPRNAFWMIMGEIYGAGPDKPYEERVKILLKNGVAVWDVLAHCDRPGSLDSAITAAVPHDFVSFFARHAGVGLVVCNGGSVSRLFRKYVGDIVPAWVVVREAPSTSPAHARMKPLEKARIWEQILRI